MIVCIEQPHTSCFACIFIFFPFPFCHTLVIRICIRFVWQLWSIPLNDWASGRRKIHPLDSLKAIKKKEKVYSLLQAFQELHITLKCLRHLWFFCSDVHICTWCKLLHPVTLSSRNEKIVKRPALGQRSTALRTAVTRVRVDFSCSQLTLLCVSVKKQIVVSTWWVQTVDLRFVFLLFAC